MASMQAICARTAARRFSSTMLARFGCCQLSCHSKRHSRRNNVPSSQTELPEVRWRSPAQSLEEQTE
jgi:hypothetical protein